MNRINLIGRLVRDIELRKTASGISTTTFTIACDRRLSQEQRDQGMQAADFIQCVAWRSAADFLAKYAHKGSCVAVDGRLTTRSYEDSRGDKHFVCEVQAESVSMPSQPKVNNESAPAKEYQTNLYGERTDNNGIRIDDVSSDDLPFY